MKRILFEELAKDFWRFNDTCNVYVFKRGSKAIAVDFGSGKWLDALPGLGIETLEHVFLTHHHDDQCAGLSECRDRYFTAHAPAGEETFLDPDREKDFHRAPWYGAGCPSSYAAPRRRIPDVKYDLSGFGGIIWDGLRIGILHTPGHGPNACSIIIPHDAGQIVCCGDAAHAGATIWQPYHLEWDHWTGKGALAAWEGIERLRGIAIDLLCPSHGPVVSEQPRMMLKVLSCKLLDFYREKGQISPGENDRQAKFAVMKCGAKRILPHLFQFGRNGYLLTSSTGDALIADPMFNDLPELEALLAELKAVPTAMLVSHYHYDHCDGIPQIRDKYGATAWLHPCVAAPLARPDKTILPWLQPWYLGPFEMLPEKGVWNWREYSFEIAHWPGQTWWHSAALCTVDRRKVLFAGDSFQPSSVWNGTGGFCAFNNSRFQGFAASAQQALEWRPNIMAAGHSNCYRFYKTKFSKIKRWALRAEAAVTALCPSGNMEQDYYSVFDHVAEDGFVRIPLR